MVSRSALILALVVLTACGGGSQEVLVSTASSLTDAFAAIETEFEAQHPGVDIVLNVGGSSALARQIVEGAPADVLAVADRRAIDVAGAQQPFDIAAFTTNRMTIAVPAGNPGAVQSAADLADADLLVGLCAPEVPCGAGAVELLDSAGVAARVDTLEPSVRALLAKLAAGELDAGVVYVTDIGAAGGAVVAVETEGAALTEYWIGAVSGRDGARAFVDFVLSEDGQRILAAHGFAS